MHPSSITSYYPTYQILDGVLSHSTKYDQINLYIDLKNVMSGIYIKDIVLNIIDRSIQTNYIDTSIFSSIIQHLVFHKRYADSRNLKIKFFFFFETGTSVYHLNIFSKYKHRRRISDTFGLDYKQKKYIKKILDSNFELIHRALNKLKDVNVFRLNHMEADFVPYYLMSRDIVDTTDNVVHLLYSNDHDMLQCLNKNVFIFDRKNKNLKRVHTVGGALKRELRYEDDIDLSEYDEYFPLILAILGDNSDDIPGVYGVSKKSVIKHFHEIIKLFYPMDDMYEKIDKNESIIRVCDETTYPKKVKQIIDAELNDKIITRNLKLISFEYISRVLDTPVKTDMADRKKYINEIISNTELENAYVLQSSLEKVGVYFDDNSFMTSFSH